MAGRSLRLRPGMTHKLSWLHERREWTRERFRHRGHLCANLDSLPEEPTRGRPWWTEIFQELIVGCVIFSLCGQHLKTLFCRRFAKWRMGWRQSYFQHSSSALIAKPCIQYAVSCLFPRLLADRPQLASRKRESLTRMNKWNRSHRLLKITPKKHHDWREGHAFLSRFVSSASICQESKFYRLGERGKILQTSWSAFRFLKVVYWFSKGRYFELSALYPSHSHDIGLETLRLLTWEIGVRICLVVPLNSRSIPFQTHW